MESTKADNGCSKAPLGAGPEPAADSFRRDRGHGGQLLRLTDTVKFCCTDTLSRHPCAEAWLVPEPGGKGGLKTRDNTTQRRVYEASAGIFWQKQNKY